MRSCLLVLLLAVLAAEETVTYRLDYQGGNLALAAGAPNDLHGGVHVWYGGAHLFADHIHWVQTPVPPGDRLWLERLNVMPGPAGPDPERILLDSTAAVLVGLGFRGRLRPRSLVATRLASDPGMPGVIRWQVVLDQPGWFAGDLNLDGAWVPHGGWAHTIAVDLTARADGGALRCRGIHLYGKPASDGEPAVRCRLDRLRTAVRPAEALADQPPTAAEFALEGSAISILFSELGVFDGLTPTGATTMYGSPPRSVRLRDRSGLDADEVP